MVGMGLTKLVRPIIEELPLVSSFFGDFDQFFMHTIRNRKLEKKCISTVQFDFQRSGYFLHLPAPITRHPLKRLTSLRTICASQADAGVFWVKECISHQICASMHTSLPTQTRSQWWND
jgi:hypothetical protein